MRIFQVLVLFASLLCPAHAQRRLVLIDQDGSGPGGSNQMSMMVFLQSSQVEVLGITMVTGNAWRDDEVQHTLRMLELIGRPDVPVVPGAVFPLVRTQQETRLAFPLHGTPVWLGAWGRRAVDVALPPGSSLPSQSHFRQGARSLRGPTIGRGFAQDQTSQRGRCPFPHPPCPRSST